MAVTAFPNAIASGGCDEGGGCGGEPSGPIGGASGGGFRDSEVIA